ncbi:hypothetical protein [Gillisia limnaea]|uniref:hypothetical protein n=1 Tax=Gillisia limnaea TaxID=195907 RepID=UPI0002D87A2B|nr:hypothetical protein [Gillisia limnaea]
MEALLNNPGTKIKFPFGGEYIKVMGVKNLLQFNFPIEIAMIDKLAPITSYQILN